MRPKRGKLNGRETCMRKIRKYVTFIRKLKGRNLGRPEIRWGNTKTDIKELGGREYT
jgi:hypothetical protein